MPRDDGMPEANPFVDVATHLFLEDLAAKVGVAGLHTYLVSLARNLAGHVPREEYDTWDEFLEALRQGRSILSAFEDIRTVTPHCIVTPKSPFERGWREYAKRVGAFPNVHREVAEYDNARRHATAVNSCHVVLHTFREAAAARISVGGARVRCESLATVWVDGARKVVPKERLGPLLKRAGISEGKLEMLLRTNADVWVVTPEDATSPAAAGA